MAQSDGLPHVKTRFFDTDELDPTGAASQGLSMREISAACSDRFASAAMDRGAGSSSPIKVLILIPTLDIGGAEMDLVRNLPRIDRSRFKIVVWPFAWRGEMASDLLDAGIEVIGPGPEEQTWPTGAASNGQHGARPSQWRRFVRAGRDYMRVARLVAAYIRDHDVHILHTILPSAYLIGVLANALAGRRPLMMSRVSLNWYQETSWLWRNIERQLLHRAADLAVGNSRAILRELHTEGISDERTLLIHNGIDLATFAGAMIDRQAARSRLDLEPNALVYSIVATLAPYKGYDDLLNALHLVRDRLPRHWTLLAAGRDVDGSAERLNRLAGRLGLSPHVRFLGQRSDIPAILSAADIHVSASHHEGFPNSILEAMCAGLPVVATAVGGVPEQVVDGVTGLLVAPHDPSALAAALHVLAGDANRRAVMGAAARLRVGSHFPIESSVAALQEAYSRLADGRAGRIGGQRRADRIGT
ncbi:MAG TPA: glycosyltransferase [Xanthobacteraceae bacterium]|nr:glycosyltransferase [Xanthobacteraceae bacterium]